MKNVHYVVTKDYPENSKGGVMVCGIDFGFSKADEEDEAQNASLQAEAKSFFSDVSVRKSDKFRQRVLGWLALWGGGLSTEQDKVTSYERSYFQTNWLDEQNHSNDGPVSLLVKNCDGILRLIEARMPRLIIFCGANLIEALNDVSIRERVEVVLGRRLDNARPYHRPAINRGKQFKVLVQKWPRTTVVSIPHPTGSRGVQDNYMAQFEDLLRPLLRP